MRVPRAAAALCRSLAVKSAMAATAVALLAASFDGAEARITNIVITSKTSPAFNGQTFGSVGQYEQLVGTAYGEVDPRDPRNAIIQDIAIAPRNKNGMVEYSMDINILKPIDPAQGNHVLLFDVANRGNMIIPTSFNVGATAANPAGDGFLENQGFTMVWAGWQADLVPSPSTGRIAMTVPVVHGTRAGGVEILLRMVRAGAPFRSACMKSPSRRCRST